MEGLKFLVCLVLLVSISGHVTSCPSNCQCLHGYRNALNVLCSSANLDDIPRDVSSDARMLDLSRNRITSVGLESFSNWLEGLLELYLEENQIDAIAAGSFNLTRNLTTLNLANNRLSHIEDGTFDSLSSLSVLHISRNWLTRLPRTIFRDLGSLSLLHLEGNRLNLIENGTFRPLNRLAYLRMENNQLSKLDADLFGGLTNLREVYISGNLITAVHPHSFHSNPHLTKLNISNNSLPIIPQLRNITSLKSLILDHNLISSLSFNNIPVQYGLLEKLSLRQNKIHLIDDRLSQILPSIRELDCSGNELTSLNSRMGDFINSTESVDLSGNPWHCDYRLYWVTKWSFPENIFGTCRLPWKYSGRTLASLAEEDFYLAPIESALPSTYTFSDAEPLAIICPVIAFPSPRISWSFGGQGVIKPSRDDEFYIQGTLGKLINSSLYFERPGKSIEGAFQCTATNAIGQLKLRVKVTYMPRLFPDGKSSQLGTHIATTPPPVTSGKSPKMKVGGVIIISAVVLLFVVAFISNTLYVVDREIHTGRARISSVAPIIE